MPPKKKRTVELSVQNISVHYDEDSQSYNTGLDVEDGDTVTVLDFTETWQNESGILTVAVARG